MDKIIPFENLKKQADAMKRIHKAKGVIIFIIQEDEGDIFSRMGVSDGLTQDQLLYAFNVGIHNTFVITNQESYAEEDNHPAA